MQRRHFLALGSAIGAALTQRISLAQPNGSAGWDYDGGYGPLKPAIDEATGLHLIDLPEGFRYFTYGWTGDKLGDGVITPERHDGMAVVKQDKNIITLIRNHEVFRDSGAFGSEKMQYDPGGGGGTTTLQFNTERGEFVDSWASLSGTMVNCCGGLTENESWLSCEEGVLTPGEIPYSPGIGYQGLKREHGYVFEVPADGVSNAKPIKDMGRFAHEAVAQDPNSGCYYLTEDRYVEAGLYRFIPNDRKNLHAGGELQMLKVSERREMRRGVPVNTPMDVSWVPIEEPDRAHAPGIQSGAGCYQQGAIQGGARFERLEGCWYGDGKVYFTSTSGGDAGRGQVFCLDIEAQTLHMVYQSPGSGQLDYPDNITISPNGCVVICEDGRRVGQMVMGLTPRGKLFPMIRNHMVLNGEHKGIAGDFRQQEWCGACFSPDGKWLFVNCQTPGVTLAITGPFNEGVL